MHALKPKRNLRQQVVDELGRQIIKGEFGEVFPTEAELTLTFGVSRTIIREAVKVLTEKGLIVSRTKIGTRIQPRSHWNLLDPDVLQWEYSAGSRQAFFQRLTEVRLIIEPASAELAAQRATAEELATIQAIYHEMEAAFSDQNAYIAADMRFHAAIVHASHNELLEQIVSVIRNALTEIRVVTATIPGSNQSALPKHYAVMDAICQREPDKAAQTMRSLIQQVGEDISQWLATTYRG